MIYRNLSPDEIKKLIRQRCSAENWNKIQVPENLVTDYIEDVHFSGDIRIGCFEQNIGLPGGIYRHSGLYSTSLHNCTIGNNTLIEKVVSCVNYDIGENCIIRNVGEIITDRYSSFGNGIFVEVLNETGGREIPIFNELSAQLAYMIAMYRHSPVLIENLNTIIRYYADGVSSTRGKIGSDVSIINTNCIQNVCIGDNATIEGTSHLKNGTINSVKTAPVYVGYNVIAEDFIIASNAYISNGATLIRCFVGQASHLGHLFSVHDSIFSCNCQCENGETCATFAGPFSVSMHKSSLLIACLTSFLNAGSGSNQSNHLYKLGPNHHGIMERGVKTTSDSYVLWPAKIGAFSLIMGRHVSHPDTSVFPFSYLIEKTYETYLFPGINLKSVGTIRDVQKWPRRDKRTDKKHLDLINFNLLSPFTVEKMLKGIEVLKTIEQTYVETAGVFSYQGMKIKKTSLKKGIELYTKAVHKFLGNSLIKQLENKNIPNDNAIRSCLRPELERGTGKWIDLAGLIAPQEEINQLIKGIESKDIKSIAEITAVFQELYNDYYQLEWSWAWETIKKWYNISLETVTSYDIMTIIKDWKNSVVILDTMLKKDAMKEFEQIMQIGFGTDGEQEEKTGDFQQVRGSLQDNAFIKMLDKHIYAKIALGDELISRLHFEH